MSCNAMNQSIEWAILAKGLSKSYEIYERPNMRLRQFIWPRIQKRLGLAVKKYYRDFNALHGISFTVPKGQTIGIIGRNGSGKSTLLQIICGTLYPSAGTVQVKGRVAALLELGSGFNPEFTGRENVFFNASILGQDRKVTEEKFSAIEAFADIGSFIDQPVKTYSSGMLVRLAFAVIAHVDADILVIDEALAVGDAFFTQKCMRFLREFMQQGTVLFVSHDLGAVKNLCNHVLWIDQGQLRYSGDAHTACNLYLEELFKQPAEAGAEPKPVTEPLQKNPLSTEQGEKQKQKKSAHSKDNAWHSENKNVPDIRDALINTSTLRNDIHVFEFNPDAAGFQSGKAFIKAVEFCNPAGQPLNFIVGGETIVLKIKIWAKEKINSPIVGFYIKDRLGQNLFGDNTWLSYCDNPLDIPENHEAVTKFVFSMPRLHVGSYTITVALAAGTQTDFVQHHWIHDALEFASHTSSVAGGLLGIPMQEISLEIMPVLNQAAAAGEVGHV